MDGETLTRVRELPDDAVPSDQWLLPGLVDIQVNGFAGADLNAPDLDGATVAGVTRQLQSVGVTRFCPTVCTQSHERMARALAAVYRVSAGARTLAFPVRFERSR